MRCLLGSQRPTPTQPTGGVPAHGYFRHDDRPEGSGVERRTSRSDPCEAPLRGRGRSSWSKPTDSGPASRVRGDSSVPLGLGSCRSAKVRPEGWNGKGGRTLRGSSCGCQCQGTGQVFQPPVRGFRLRKAWVGGPGGKRRGRRFHGWGEWRGVGCLRSVRLGVCASVAWPRWRR